MLETLTEKVDPANAALVVVDWQNDFCYRSGGQGTADGLRTLDGVPEAHARLQELIAGARQVGLAVVFVATIHGSDVDSEVWLERRRDRSHFRPQADSWGFRFYGDIEPLPDEDVVIKHRWSAFINTDLQSVLERRGVRSLIMAGTSANGCVEKTALDGFQLDYYIVAASDCMATSHPDGRSMAEVFSFGVAAPSDEIMACWEALPAGLSSARK